MSISAMKQALEVLSVHPEHGGNAFTRAADALRQALAESANSTTNLVEPKASFHPEQEPVKEPFNSKAGVKEAFNLDRGCWERGCMAYDERDGDGVNISAERVDETAKREHEWVGLTEADIYDAMDNKDEFDFAKAIEAKLKEKNT